MKRRGSWCPLALSIVMVAAPALNAEVRTKEKTQVKFEGVLGRLMNMFGGKAAKDGIVSSTAVKGDRQATMTGETGRIVDLAEEKVYELDLAKKTYEVTTFDELRRRMQEAEDRAEESAAGEQGEAEKDPQQAGKEVEIDVDVKETGQTRSIAGYNARQVITTITVREKGRTLEDGGGLVMTSDSWLGPVIPELKELSDFERRYWKALAPEAAGVSAEQMAAVVAMYPMVAKAMERMAAEGDELEGTPLSTTMTFESVKSKEQIAQQSGGGGGGLGGMLARRIMKRNDKPRSVLLTTSTEILEISTTVAASDLAVPEGFKEKK